MKATVAFRRPWSDSLAPFVVACLAWGQLTAAQAAPAQQPLIKRGDGAVAPNIFYTIDDSGSMGMTYAPSDDTVWPGENINYRNVGFVSPMLHPSDPMVPSFLSGGNGMPCYVRTPLASATDDTSLRAMMLRSRDHNRIYYNPDITYKPWARANPTDANFGNSSITAAPYDPIKIYSPTGNVGYAGSVNLITAYFSTNNDVWCTNNGYQSASRVAMFPATYYLRKGNGFVRVALGNDESGNAFFTNASFLTFQNTTPIRGKNRTDCVTEPNKCTLAEERQNFANWYTYYRTRSLLARGASSLAFSKLEDPMRVGYGRINFSGNEADNIAGAPRSTVQRGVRDFTVNTAARKEFFEWLYRVPASGGTPLRRAMDDVGRYFMVTNTAGPWGNTPGTADTKNPPTPLASCRKSFHILMTDGYWNGAAATTAKGNHDGVDSPTEIKNADQTKTYRYRKSATDGIASTSPYADNFSGTLADVAAYYWQTDLFPEVSATVKLDNNVKANTSKTDTSKPYYSAAENIDRGDHAFWQHLSTYTVGLGVAGSIADTSKAPPSTNWPQPVPDGPTAVDDLWHAAVNGRGKYISAQDPQEFQDAMETALNAILSSIDAKTGVAVSAPVVNGSTKKYIPSFNSPAWTGDVTAALLTDSSSSPIWSATDSLPPFGSRQIYTWNGSQAVAFDASLSSTLRNSMGGASDSLINFLRGDRSLEGTSYRCRGDSPGTKVCTQKPANAGLFGDVINSTPVRIGESSVDLGYQLLPSQDSSRNTYRAHFNAKKARKSAVIAVGANDGMLHFLDDSNGKELLGYIPATALPNLGRLSSKNYGLSTEDANINSHRFYVDGPIVETDAFLNGAWTNVVIGSAGAGGKSIFAFKLATNNPTALTKDSVMWELNDGAQNAQAANLGHVTSPVAVGRMADGRWAAVFGNGLDSTNGTASLWIVDLATGQPLRAPIQVSTETGNGLGGVTLVRNAQRVVVAAYAGDALGRLWRFDLESTSASGWKVGFGGAPLLTNSQPITAAPTYLSHPKGGLMVLFGTGKLYANGDQSNVAQQSLYGVWDVTKVGKASEPGKTASLNKLTRPRVLTSTTISAIGSPIKGFAIEPANPPISFTDHLGDRGWVLDLQVVAGERAIYNPFVLLGYAYFNTMAPQVATQGDPCISQSSNFWQYTINPYTGEMPQFSLYDTNGDGTINNQDTRISVITVPGDGLGAGTPVIVESPCVGANCKSSQGCSGKAGGVAYSSGTVGFCGADLTVQRTWRQIVNFPKSNATGN